MSGFRFDGPFDPSRIAFVDYFVGNATVMEALDQVCHSALEAVPDATFAGVTMTLEAKVGTYVFTDAAVVEIDEQQYRTGRGPCVDAFRTGQVVRVGSTDEPGPYPEFCRAALAHDVLSVLSMPLIAESRVVGALNLYAPVEDAFHAVDIEVARSFATSAAFALLNHQAYWEARSLSENLQRAMESRAEIEQAKGIIMAATGCTPDEAFAELRRQSQHENIKLRDIAREIVQRAQGRRVTETE